MEDIADWNLCPPELLYLIFKYLDVRALTKSMLVSKQWNNIAKHTIERYKMWDSIVNKVITNKGTTFKYKSTLDSRNIFKNVMLWNHVEMADIKLINTYDIQDVKRMNVYRDEMILVNYTHVMYYNINTFELIRSVNYTCLDFVESEYAIALLFQEGENMKLQLIFKSHIDDFTLGADYISDYRYIDDVKLFRLEGFRCYVYTNSNVLLVTRFDTNYTVGTVARHYGTDTPIAIHVWNECVYIVTNYGIVWQGVKEEMRFIKKYSLQELGCTSYDSLVMFDEFSFAVCVPTKSLNCEHFELRFDHLSDAIMLECSQLTCGLSHGDVLFLGYKDGRVEICLPRKHIKCRRTGPDRSFNIKQFTEHCREPAVVGLNVCETENSHNLLVGTRSGVYQFLITYPEGLLEMY